MQKENEMRVLKDMIIDCRIRSRAAKKQMDFFVKEKAVQDKINKDAKTYLKREGTRDRRASISTG